MHRISFVLPDFFAGGAQRVLISLAAGLDPSQYQREVVVLNAEGPWRKFVPDDIPVHELGTSGVKRSWYPLLRALRETAPDLVVSTMSYVNFALLSLKPFLKSGTRVVVREANALRSEANSAASRIFRKAAFPLLYGIADKVISPSDLIADELATGFHVPANLISVLRNQVNQEELRKSAKPVRREEGSGQRFVCVGRLSPQKGYDRLLPIIAGSGETTQLKIFGEGPERAALEIQCKDLNLSDRVEFAGFNANPAPWVAGADALLLPSRWEGLPNVALEALAGGTPVIATPESGAIAEIAALAPVGAVTIANIQDAFGDAVESTPILGGSRMRKSLLPQEFTPAAVNAAFDNLLQETLTNGRNVR